MWVRCNFLRGCRSAVVAKKDLMLSCLDVRRALHGARPSPPFTDDNFCFRKTSSCFGSVSTHPPSLVRYQCTMSVCVLGKHAASWLLFFGWRVAAPNIQKHARARARDLPRPGTSHTPPTAAGRGWVCEAADSWGGHTPPPNTVNRPRLQCKNHKWGASHLFELATVGNVPAIQTDRVVSGSCRSLFSVLLL